MLQKLEAKLGRGRVERNFILAPYTTFKAGGPAQFYFEAESEEELVVAIQAAYQCRIGATILGGASNVIISDRGIRGLVIRNRTSKKEIVEELGDKVKLHVASGYPMTRLARETADEGLSGLEYHVGLPGTVGGAIFMNSKWTNPEAYVGDCLVEAQLVDRAGRVRVEKRDYFRFAYDSSTIQKTGEIVVWAVFLLEKLDPKITKERAAHALLYRKETQPYGVASSGCFFKNVDGRSAGELIDKLGLKGFSVGGAQVSDKHANFILNRGSARSEDVRKLVSHIEQKIKTRYGVTLEHEVILL